MRGSRRSCLLLLSAILAIAAPSPSNAQAGILKKKIADKAKKAVSGDEGSKGAGATKVPDQDTAIPFGNGLLELTEPVLVALEKGLRKEIELRESFAKEIAAMNLKTPEQYDECSKGIAMTPAGQKIALNMAKMMEGKKPEELKKVMEQNGKEMQALKEKTCGPDPSQYGESWRGKRLDEIQKMGAAAAGPITSRVPDHDNAPALGAPALGAHALGHGGPYSAEDGIRDDALDVSSTAHPSVTSQMGGMTIDEYLFAQERVLAFCVYKQSGQPLGPGPKKFWIPTGQGKYWVYTAAEVQSLLKACPTLMGLLKQLNP